MPDGMNVKPCPCPSVEELKSEFKEQQGRIHKGDVTFERIAGILSRMEGDITDIKKMFENVPTRQDYENLKAEFDNYKLEFRDHKQAHEESKKQKIAFWFSVLSGVMITVASAIIIWKFGIN